MTICKIIRDGNEQTKQRKRAAYDGPIQAIFYECEQKYTLTNQRFIDDYSFSQKQNFVFSPFLSS